MSVNIYPGKLGYYLRVDGLFISMQQSEYGLYVFKAIMPDHNTPSFAPYGSSQWVSVAAIRSVWNDYREIICASLRRPYQSVWGSIIPA